MSLKFLFRSPSSILLAYDRVTGESAGEILEQIDEVKKYYRFDTVPKFIEQRRGGKALLVFENPRKGAFLHVLPVLIAENIPFTLFLRPECVGTNRLPFEEEEAVLKAEYPQEKEALLWERPFPFHKTDPLDYMSTWGKIRELPPSSFDIGVNFQGRIFEREKWEEDLVFCEKLLGRRPKVALLDGKMEELRSLGIEAIVTRREGEIGPQTSLYDLPRYSLKKKD